MLNYNDFNNYEYTEGTTKWMVYYNKNITTGKAMEAVFKRNKSTLYEVIKAEGKSESKDLVIIIDENANVNYGICVGEFLGIM